MIFLTGCGQALPADRVTDAPTVVDTGAPVETESPEEPRTTLRISIPNPPATLNPVKVREAETANFLSLIYESPIALDENAKPQPELFESWECDGAEWTFQVRKGVKWHGSGASLTAFDIEYTLNKIMEPFKLSDDGEELESIYREAARLIESCRAVDETTFKLTAAYPGLDVLYALCFPVTPKDDEGSLAGTGPYMVEVRSSGGEYTLSVNPDWWKQPPVIQTIIAKPMKSAEDRIAAFERGELDLVYESAGNAPRYTAFTDASMREVTTRYYYYLLPNLNNRYLGDPNFRRAVSCAINRKDVIFASVYGYGVAAENAVMPDSWLFDTNADHVEYDENQAIEYLKAGGYGYLDARGQWHNQGNIAELKLLVPADKESSVKRDIADTVKSRLSKIGISVTVSVCAADEYAAAIEAGGYDLTICKLYLDAVPNLEKLYGIDGELNLNRYSSPAMELSLQAARADDEKSYQRAYIDIQHAVSAEMPAIGLFFQTAAVIYHDNIRGVGRMNDLRVYKGVNKWEISSSGE